MLIKKISVFFKSKQRKFEGDLKKDYKIIIKRLKEYILWNLLNTWV